MCVLSTAYALLSIRTCDKSLDSKGIVLASKAPLKEVSIFWPLLRHAQAALSGQG